MLNKLLKYDLKYMIKNMSVFYILSVFFAIVTRILSLLHKTTITTIIYNITLGIFISMLFNVLINTMIRSWIRFRDSIYKDEAYLTHTLPVTKNDIYNSKFIQPLIFYLVGFIVIVLSLFIAFYTKDNWDKIEITIRTVTINLNISTLFFVIMMLIIIFLEVFNAIQCGFLGIILGYKQSNAKLGFSVLFGFSGYMIAQSLVLALMAVVGLFNSDIMRLFKSQAVLDGSSFITLYVGSSILYVLIILIMSILAKKLLNKGVNIE